MGTGIRLLVRTVTIDAGHALQQVLRSDTVGLVVMLAGLLGMLFAVVWWDSWDCGDDTASAAADPGVDHRPSALEPPDRALGSIRPLDATR